MRTNLILKSVILVFALLAGCAHVPDKDKAQYYGYSSGKCWNWTSIEKKATKKGYCGWKLVRRNKIFVCSRNPGHGGWHHAHIDGSCVVVW